MKKVTLHVSSELAKELKSRKTPSSQSAEDVIWDLIEGCMELSGKTKRDIKKARAQIKAGKVHTLEQVKKELGFSEPHTPSAQATNPTTKAPLPKIPHVNLKELKRQKEQNFQERLKFIDLYVEWLQRTPNKEWSRQQKQLIDGQQQRKQVQ